MCFCYLTLIFFLQLLVYCFKLLHQSITMLLYFNKVKMLKIYTWKFDFNAILETIFTAIITICFYILLCYNKITTL